MEKHLTIFFGYKFLRRKHSALPNIYLFNLPPTQNKMSRVRDQTRSAFKNAYYTP